MAPTVAPELLESVYSFLIKNGHDATAKSLAKEAKLDAKALKNSTATDLSEIFSSSLKYAHDILSVDIVMITIIFLFY